MSYGPKVYKDNNGDQQRQKEEQALNPWSGPGQ